MVFCRSLVVGTIVPSAVTPQRPRRLTMETIVSVLIPLLFVLMLATERLVPARPLPVVRRWWLKGIVFFVLALAFNAVIPMVLAGWVGTRSLLHLSVLGTVGGAVVAVLVGDLVNYWVHRTLHRVPALWR